MLTTIVTRRSDRRRSQAGPCATKSRARPPLLGSAGGNRVEVPTDATGRSSIEISPTSTGVGEALVNVRRRARRKLTAAANLATEVGRSTTTITWKPGVPGRTAVDSGSRRAGERDAGTGDDRPAAHRSVPFRYPHPTEYSALLQRAVAQSLRTAAVAFR